jgi:hypothetical protein
MGEPTHEALLVHLEYIRKAADQTNAHLATLNGRMGDAEQAIAVIQSQESDARTAGAKYGSIFGGLIAGAAMVWQFFQGGK